MENGSVGSLTSMYLYFQAFYYASPVKLKSGTDLLAGISWWPFIHTIHNGVQIRHWREVHPTRDRETFQLVKVMYKNRATHPYSSPGNNSLYGRSIGIVFWDPSPACVFPKPTCICCSLGLVFVFAS